MAEVTMEAGGLWALIAEHRRAIGAKRLKELAQLACETAWVEWATGRLRPGGLPDRTKASAFAVYGYTERSDGYQKRQRKRFGRLLPFVSPPRARGQSSHPGPKLVQALRHRGTGWQVRHRGSLANARAVLTLPGARVLNLARGMAGRYRQEFLGLGDRARLEGRAVEARALELLDRFIRDTIRTLPPRRTRRTTRG